MSSDDILLRPWTGGTGRLVGTVDELLHLMARVANTHGRYCYGDAFEWVAEDTYIAEVDKLARFLGVTRDDVVRSVDTAEGDVLLELARRAPEREP